MITFFGIKFNLRPLAVIAIFLALGIFLRVKFQSESIFFILLLALFVVVIFFVTLFRNLKGFFILLLAFSMTMGSLLGDISLGLWNSSKSFEGNVSARVVEVVKREGYNQILVDRITVDGERVSGKGVLSTTAELFVGNELSFSGSIKEQKVYNGGRINSFALSNRIKLSLTAKGKLNFEQGEYDFSMWMRENARSTLSKNMNEDMAGVSYGMMFGDTSMISGSIQNNFRASGIAHIFAVSGLHMGVFFTLLSFVLKKLNASRRLLIFSSFAISTVYAYICGFSPSTIRALTMIAAYSICDFFGILKDKLSALSLAAIVVLLFNPLDVFSVGFLLSFSAMFGIIVIAPSLNIIFFRFGKVGSAFAYSLAVFLTTLPVTSYFFSYVSLISPLTNIVFIPIFSFCFVYNIIFTLPTMLFGVNFLFVTNGIIGVSIGLLEILSRFFRVSGYLSLNSVSVVISYLIVLFFSRLIFMTRKKRVVILSILSVLLILSFALGGSENSYLREIYSSAMLANLF